MKIHDEIDDWSAGALCGALSPDERKNFEQHLAECPRCRSLHEEDRKMNDILDRALAEERPDANFEGRMVAAVRGQISKGGFHPWRGMVWLLQFRVAQGALALLLLAALVAGGALVSGERIPIGGGNASNVQANTKALADSAANQVISQLTLSSTGSQDPRGLVFFDVPTDKNGNNPSLAGMTFSSTSTIYNIAGGTPNSDAFTLSGSIANSGVDNALSGTLNSSGASDPIVNQAMSGTYAGVIRDGAGGGSLGFVKAGADTLTFSGNNAYAGNTTINSGNLLVTGTTTLSSAGSDNQYTRLTVAGSGYTSSSSGTLNGSGASDLIVGVFGTGTTTVSRTIDNTGGFGMQKSGTGVLVLSGSSNTVGSIGGAGLALNGGVFGGNGKDSVNYNNVLVKNTGTQGSDLYEAGRIASINEGESKTDDPNAPKTLENQSTGAVAGGGARPAQIQMPAPLPIIDTRKLIRSATLDFEVASFDRALDAITTAAGMEQGYIFTQNSEKAPSGKLQGQIVVKVMPANLDRFLLRIHSIGDLKTQTVSAQDVSKDYYDTESRIRNSEITEARMIDLLKKRTGDVADLLEVEKEIAGVRGEIEQMQGQLKYYDGLVQFATVTITLEEKDLNQTAAYMLEEQAQLSLFAKDVEGAFTEAKNDAAAAKAQTLESHMERNVDGREIATLHLLLPPENADEAITKLKAIGRIQTFTSQTQRVARNNGVTGADTSKADRDKVELSLVIQHDVENAVQGTNISIQTEQVEDKTTQIKQEAKAAGVEVKGADFNRARNGAEVATLLLRMPMKTYPSFIERIKMLGAVKDLTVGRREDANATEDAPAEIVLQIFNQAANAASAVPAAPKITVHSTIGEGMTALKWSLRMIGVSLAFLGPWAVIGGLIAWIVAVRRRMARKQS